MFRILLLRGDKSILRILMPALMVAVVDAELIYSFHNYYRTDVDALTWLLRASMASGFIASYLEGKIGELKVRKIRKVGAMEIFWIRAMIVTMITFSLLIPNSEFMYSRCIEGNCLMTLFVYSIVLHVIAVILSSDFFDIKKCQ